VFFLIYLCGIGRGDCSPVAPLLGALLTQANFFLMVTVFNYMKDMPYLFTSALNPTMTPSKQELKFDSKDVTAVCILTV
jgi:hypothetical protein